MPPDPESPHPRRTPLGIPALFLVLSLCMGGSFLLHSDQLPLPHGPEAYDAAIYPWNFFWVKEAPGAVDGSLLFSRRFFHPVGEGLALYTPTFGHALMSLPFQTLFGKSGLLVAMAFFLWFSSLATLCMTWLLARRLGLARGAALVAALLFTCGGARLMNAPRLNLFATEFLLLFLWCAVGLWQRGGWQRVVLTVLSGVLLLVQSQPLFFQAMLALGVGLVVVAGPCLWRRRRPDWSVRKREVLATLAGFALLAAPFFSAMLGELTPAWKHAAPGDLFTTTLWKTMAQEVAANPALDQSRRLLAVPQNSLDLADLVLPAPQDAPYGTRFGGRATNPLFEGTGPAAAVSLYLGVGWCLLLVAALGARPRALVWSLLFFSLGVLWVALGPVLRWQGSDTGLPAAFTLLRWVPMVQLTKSPIRLTLLVQLGLALMAGMGCVTLWHWRRIPGRARAWVVSGLVVLSLGELCEPLPLGSQKPLVIPAEVRDWADEDDTSAVLDLPYAGYRVTAMAQALGAFHERPIFFGLYPRATRRNLDALRDTAVYQDLRRMNPTDGRVTPVVPADAAVVRRELRNLQVGRVIIHDFADLPPMVREQCQALRDYCAALGLAEQRLPVGDGYELTVYRLKETP